MRQAIEIAHVNLRKQALTNQYPVGDDVSQRQQPVRKHRVLLRAVPTNLEGHDVDRTA
jgi:hypothetical protein